MADIILKIGSVGPDPAWQDGDCVCAFSDRRILCCHAEHICHPWKHSRTRDGLRPDGLPRQFHEITHQYRFERVSRTELKRVTIATGAEEILSGKPNAAGEAIDVEEFVTRRMREKAPDGGPRLAMFGLPGAEVWYGGTIDVSPAKVSAVWDAIEAQTTNLRANHGLWPLGTLDKRHFLPLRLDAFDDATAEELHAAEVEMDPDGNEALLRRRKHRVQWRDVLSSVGVAEADVLDRNKETDGRGSQLSRAVIVRQKQKARAR